MMGDFCNGFGLYVLIIEGPDFISNVLPLGTYLIQLKGTGAYEGGRAPRPPLRVPPLRGC